MADSPAPPSATSTEPTTRDCPAPPPPTPTQPTVRRFQLDRAQFRNLMREGHEDGKTKTHTGRKSTLTINEKQLAAKLTEKELVIFNLNAAGHEGIRSNMDGSLIIKPCTQAEIDFYQAAQGKEHEDLRNYMPDFVGVLALSQDQTVPANGVGPGLRVHDKVPDVLAAHAPEGWLPSNVEALLLDDPTSPKRTSWKPSGGKKLDTPTAIVLENVASGFVHPNILDIKLGARLWADDAPDSKRRKLDEVASETTSGSLGFRIAGMKKWVGGFSQEQKERYEDSKRGIEYKDGYLCYNKLYGRSLQDHNVKDGIMEYFGGLRRDGSNIIFKRSTILDIARRVKEELEIMHHALSKEETRMYSASILVVHEGDEEFLSKDLNRYVKMVEGEGFVKKSEEEGDDDDDEEDTKLLDVRLIDFAHAAFTPGEGQDENVLEGVSSVVSIFDEIVGLASKHDG